MAFQNIITDIGYGKIDEHPLPDGLKSIKRESINILLPWRGGYILQRSSNHELMKYLDTLEKTQFAIGQPQQDLIKIIGENEYGSRSKDNFYLKEAKKEINDIKRFYRNWAL